MVDGLLAWDRELLADTLVLLPSRRACLAAREAFRRAAGGQPLLLPRLVPIGEPDEGELALDGAIELSLPPAIGPIRRRLLLTRLIRARDPTMAHEQAVRLAAELARFLDELHNEEVALDRLEGWRPRPWPSTGRNRWFSCGCCETAGRRSWPKRGDSTSRMRRRLLLDALAAKWRRTPPPMPVVAAGVTGTIPAVARLLGVIAGLPSGQVVLHALDQGLDATGLGTGRPEPSAVRAQAAPGG